MTDFIARLKQRKLVQWTLACVAVAFCTQVGLPTATDAVVLP